MRRYLREGEEAFFFLLGDLKREKKICVRVVKDKDTGRPEQDFGFGVHRSYG